MTQELEQAYEVIQMEGPITRRRMSELCGYSPKECLSILEKLVDRLLVTVFEREQHLRGNWDEYSYWTVDEWLLDHGMHLSDHYSTKKDEETILLATSKCLISRDARELAKALRWPIARVYECSKRLPLHITP